MTSKHAQRLARRWAHAHWAELNSIGRDSLRDAPGSVYHLDTLTFIVFKDNATRWEYWFDLCALAERRRVKRRAQFAIDEHSRRVRRWCRQQIALSLDRRSTVMVEAR